MLSSKFSKLFRLGTLCGVFAMLVLVTGCDPCMNNPCNDGEFCNGVETCTVEASEAVCGDGTPIECPEGEVCVELTDECLDPCANVDCDDADACTEDSCTFALDPDTGEYATECVNTPIDCDDADACTDDVCVGGLCEHNPISCDDGDACTDDSCDPATGCVNAPVDCDDGDACTDDTCVGGLCEHNPISCDDADVCTDDSCDVATGCVNTLIDDCVDGDLCTQDLCDAGVCSNPPVECPEGEFCDPETGLCGAGCTEDDECEDDDECTDDACTDGACVNTNNTAGCDDGDICTNGDSCADGVCAGTSMCPAGMTCTNGTCFSQTACTGVPTPGTDPACLAEGLACTTSVCNVGTLECEHTPNDALCASGLFCDGRWTCDFASGAGCDSTGDPCADQGKLCDEGTDTCEDCTADADCNDGFLCTDDECLAGTCYNTALDTLCPDGLNCDGVDFCDPDDPDADLDGCVQPGNPCEPQLCIEATYVKGDPGTCTKCTGAAPFDCDDGIACTDDVCNGVTGECFFTNDDDLCADLLWCDGEDICAPDDPDAGPDGCISDPWACTNACDEVTDACFDCTMNIECDDLIACTDDTCNGATGECSRIDNCVGGFTCNLVSGNCE